jgi:hypothetical protein
MLVDLHSHARPSSRDSRMSYDDLAASAAGTGVGAIALTDHGPGADFDEAERAFARHGVALVPGREIACALGHVLVLATDRAWLASLPELSQLPLPDSRRGPAALVWAHPAGWRVGGAMVPPNPSRGADHLHGVEVLNGERLWQTDGVRIAGALAAELGLAPCGGSDAHQAGAVGRCLTEARGATDALSFIEALIAGDVRPILSKRWGDANETTYTREDLQAFIG